MPVKNRFAELQSESMGWRHDLNKQPELMYETHRTGAFVVEKPTKFGCDEITSGIGRSDAYIFLGNGDTEMCHHPAYVIDDDAIPLGWRWFAELAERRMPAV